MVGRDDPIALRTVGRRVPTPPQTILGVLRSKLLRLGRDEDGAALVITLAIFFLMYLGCCGVFAISVGARERIHIQNACDAAAYSAAVVQADTLSRIATINRAMSWTYVQMTRRQMDYIVYRWLEETCRHHRADAAMAYAYTVAHNECTHGARPCPESTARTVGWDISDITLNDNEAHGENSESDLMEEYGSKFPEHMSRYMASFNFSSPTLGGLKDQIEHDLETIDKMNVANESLAKGLAGRVDSVVEGVLDANVTPAMRKDGCSYCIRRHDNPIEDSGSGMPRYLETFDNSAEGEQKFIAFCDDTYLDHFRDGGDVHDAKVFGKGIDDWFVLGDESPESDGGGKGLHRSYNHARMGGNAPLKASWEWFSTGWTCGISHGIHWRFPNSHADESDCVHGHELCLCEGAGPSGSKTDTYLSSVTKHHHVHRHYSTGTVAKWISSVCYADNNVCYDDCYKGHRGGKAVYARPLVLNEDYFGEAGTITVGLACGNENAFSRVLSSVKGLFSAFDPAVAYSWAFASAKAGYRFRDGSDGEGEYKTDWKNGAWHSQAQSWNLCISDLDAVFVPVRMAKGMAKDGRWEDGGDDVLDDIIRETWKPLGNGLDASAWDEVNAPGGVLTGNGHEGRLDWRGVSHVMFH